MLNLCEDGYFSYPAINYVTITYGQTKYEETREIVYKKDNFFMIGSGNKIELHFGFKLTENDNIFKCSSIHFYDKKKYNFI